MGDQVQITVNAPTTQDINQINDQLMNFSTVFPFDIITDQIILDRFKITVIKRDIGSEQTITLPFSVTTNVRVNRTWFFSELEISDTEAERESVFVRNVKNSDAQFFREMVEGIVVGLRQGVDFLSMDKDELIRSTLQWGSVAPE